MKITRKPQNAVSPMPKGSGFGGYNYSTDRSQNVLFNQGLDPQDPGADSATGGYDYGTRKRADDMYRRAGISRPTQASLSSAGYGTGKNKADMQDRQSRSM